MTWRLVLPVISISGLVMVTTTGCGTTGSEPTLFPEVRFEISPVQGAQPPFQFVAERFVIGGVEHTDLAGTTFTATGVFRFIFENAAPPYSGTLRQIGGTAIQVHLLQEGTGIEATQTTSGDATRCGTTTSPDPSCTVTARILGIPTTTPVAPNPEVRFDVCSPLIGSASCLLTMVCSNNATQTCTTDADCPGGSCSPDPGRFAVQFSGVIGDPFVTYLLGTAAAANNAPVSTPVIYYFEAASQSVNAVFTGFNSATLAAQLFINGGLSQSGAGNGNLVFQQDL